MTPLLALVVLLDDIVVKNPHYAHCLLLEEGSWEWWLKGCFIYDSSTLALILRFAITVGLAVWAGRSLRARARRTA